MQPSSVQRRFTKRLPGLRSYSYQDRLHCLKLQSLEQRRLCADLVYGTTRYCLELLMCNLANFLSSMYVLLEVINTSCIKNEMFRACGPPFLVNVLQMCGTLYLTVPILVHFLGLGALFNES